VLILGLTGGIASGKSTVAGMLRSLGAAVVSADGLAREVVRPGSETHARIVKHFGPRALRDDGQLDRGWLAQRIFTDPKARRALDGITHPAIADLARRRFADLARQGAGLVVYDAPLLFEAGADRQVDAVLLVTVDERVQRARLMRRDGIDEPAARARIAAQMPQTEKARRADYVIDNSGTRADTRDQVLRLLGRLGLKPDHFPAGSPESPEQG
jgi:dephospho-CoA kinase